MEKKEVYLTPEGADKFRRELDELRGPKRTDIARRLRLAIQQGDLSENADYIATKEEQAFLEGKILELEVILREAIIVDSPESKESVGIGNTIVVKVDGQETQIYQLVGIKEADPRNGKISNESPIGRSLLGKRIGDVATADTPAGVVKMQILEIR